MNDFIAINGESVAVSINGEKLPLVESVTEEKTGTAASVYCFGESEPREQTLEKCEYGITIVKLPGGIPVPSGSFTLTLSDGVRSVSYLACRCKKHETVMKAGEPIKESWRIAAARREENA